MENVLEMENFAVFAGREKLVFDSIRLGRHNFHINKETFFTKFKGIVLRNGCPFKEVIDGLVIRLFEAGIVDKITQVSKFSLNQM